MTLASKALKHYPASRPLTADQVTEFHAARLLLLLYLCGTKGRIVGLTKLAKLDFFVRYPDFFQRASKLLEHKTEAEPTGTTESAMVRHHYGPWDPRYYQILGYLEGRELIKVEREKKTFVFSLAKPGLAAAKKLAADPAYQDLCEHMRSVKKLLGDEKGDDLKKLVYELFDREVAQLPMGTVIRP